MTKLILDLQKADAAILNARGAIEEQRWSRMPGAASMFNARELKTTADLMGAMPTPKLAINDGNFTSPDDVVKGLGFEPRDETIWAHRVARLVTRAPNEVSLRKSLYSDLRQEALDPDVRHELNRRVLSLYRQNQGGKPLEKAFPQKAQPGAPQAPGMAPKAKPQAPGRAPSVPEDDEPGKPSDPNAPAVDDAPLEGMPTDQALLKQKIHALHEQLTSLAGSCAGNAAKIHMHNEIKAAMRTAYRDPDPDVIARIDHDVHHFAKMVEGPQPMQADPSAAPQMPGQKVGAPQPGMPGQQQKPPPMMQKSDLTIDLKKAGGPYIGPRGGKWADPQFTIPWKEGGGGGAKPRPTVAPAAEKAPGQPPTAAKPSPNKVTPPGAPVPASSRDIGGVKVHQYPPGQAPQSKHLDERGRPTKRHWIDHHPDHPTFEDGGTAVKYGIDAETLRPSDPARAKLHDEIVSAHLDHVKPVPAGQKPVAIVTMGGPASGKSTALKTLGYAGRSDFVLADPDAVKTGEPHLGTKGLPEFHEGVGMGHLDDGTPVSSKTAAAVTHDESSFLAHRIREAAVEQRKNMIVDGTGKNADKHIKLIKDLKAKGYHVHLVMPHQTADAAKKLNKGRAAATGRHVPEDVVDEAYAKIPHNWDRVSKVADHATLFDATGGFPPDRVYDKNDDGETNHNPQFMTKFHAEHGHDKIQKSETVMPQKIKTKRPPAIDAKRINTMLDEAFTAGARTEGGYLAAGSADEGIDDSVTLEDDHFDMRDRGN